MNQKFRLILGLMLGSQLCCWAVEDDRVTLDVFAQKDQVRLLWQAYGWPKNVDGFNIKRREIKNAEWILLNQSPIFPRILEDSDYSNQGLSEHQATTVKSAVRGFFEKGSLKEITISEAIENLQQRGMLVGDRIMLKRDYNFALALGFGFIDNHVNSTTKYEYAVFGVNSDGAESQAPLATCRASWVTENDTSAQVNLLTLKQGGNVQLSWECPEDICDQFGILKWKIYRKQREADKWNSISEIGIASGKKNSTNIFWQVRDDESNSAKNYDYAVAPVNRFQFEFVKSTSKYSPPKMESAQITKLELRDQSLVYVEWNIDTEVKDQVASFKVIRSVEGEDEYHQVGEAVANGRFVLDQNPSSKKRLSYKIVTVGKKGEEFISKPKTIYFEGTVLPDRPGGLQLSFFQKGEKSYVRGDWPMPAKSDTLVGYRLFSNPQPNRVLMENGSFRLSVTNSYIWELKNVEGNREFTFGIQPVDDQGRRGERVLSSLFIPRLKAPSKIDLQASYSGIDGNIHLTWKYPIADDLIGFRLYLDGKLILSEKVISKNARGWVLTDYPGQTQEKCRLEYHIEAVFPLCSHKSSSVSSRVTVGTRRPDRTISAPKFFHAKPRGVFQGRRWVELEWQKEYDPRVASRIRGYLLKVATDAAFKDSVKIPLDICDTYYFEVPEKWVGKTLYFHCSARGKRLEGGLYAEASVSSNPAYWRNELEERPVNCSISP